MKKHTFQQLISFVCVVISASAIGYEIPNHADMSENALLKSALFLSQGKLSRLGLKQVDPRLNAQRFPLPSNLPAIPTCFGVVRGADGAMAPNAATQPPWNTDSGRTVLSIVNLIRYGACYEDNEGVLLVTNQRPIAHFYDPQKGGIGIATGPSSPDWMLANASTNTSGTNHYGWADARGAFYRALTYRDASGGVSAAENDLARKGGWADTFQSLGHLIHHLQDMAQPQHVRSDDHCDAAQCAAVPGATYKPSGYEKHLLNNRLEFVQTLAASASAPIMFGLPREFWNAVVPVNQPLTGAANLQGQWGTQFGMATYTATNFVSMGSNYRRIYNGAVYETKPDPQHPYPVPAAQPVPVSLATLYANAPTGTLNTLATTLCGGDLTTCFMQFLGTEADPNAKTAATGSLSPELFNPPNTFRGDALLGPYTQNYFTYDDAATKLVPRAVEYSAGLINYFFRGEMDISLPEEGVYSVLDHAVDNVSGRDGFRRVKLKLTNTTAAIATPTRGAIAQDMSSGQFVAVARFRRNTCYTPDLTGQIGQIGQAPTSTTPTTSNPWSCRSAVDEIVVSNPATQWIGDAATGSSVPMTTLRAGDVATLLFEFANPIPVEATDLYLQVVFKGQLGDEVGAVAVTTKDVSEPSFMSFMDASDYRVCRADFKIRPQRSDPIDCGRWSPDSGSVPLVDPFAEPTLFSPQNAFEYGLWVGFGADKNNVLARLPDTGIPNGGFVRIGFLTDIGYPTVTAWHGYSTTSSLPYTKTVDDGSFAVDDANYARWPVQIAVARVQARDDDPTQPDSELPRYWQVRGQVLAAIRPLSGSGDDLPSPVIYRGEPLWDTDPNIYVQNHLDKPWGVTILDRGIYPIVAAAPTPLARIAFGAVTNRVPATYASILPPTSQPVSVGSTQKLPIWGVVFPYSYGFRHTMSANAVRLY